LKRQALVKLEFVLEIDDDCEMLPFFRQSDEILMDVASRLSPAPIALIPGGRISVRFTQESSVAVQGLSRIRSKEDQSILYPSETPVHPAQQQADETRRTRRVTDMLARFETTTVARVHNGLFEDVGVIRYHALASFDSIDDALDRLESFLGVREEA
jgi:hypothetical protein